MDAGYSSDCFCLLPYSFVCASVAFLTVKVGELKALSRKRKNNIWELWVHASMLRVSVSVQDVRLEAEQIDFKMTYCPFPVSVFFIELILLQ